MVSSEARSMQQHQITDRSEALTVNDDGIAVAGMSYTCSLHLPNEVA